PRTGRRGNALDMSFEFASAVGIDFDRDRLSHTHTGELRLLEIRSDPDLFERNDRHERLARLNDLPRLDALPADDTFDWRFDDRIFEIEFGLFDGSLGLLHARLRRFGPSAGRGHLLWRCFGGPQLGRC